MPTSFSTPLKSLRQSPTPPPWVAMKLRIKYAKTLGQVRGLQLVHATQLLLLLLLFNGRDSLVGCCLWGRPESDTTEAT